MYTCLSRAGTAFLAPGWTFRLSWSILDHGDCHGPYADEHDSRQAQRESTSISRMQLQAISLFSSSVTSFSFQVCAFITALFSSEVLWIQFPRTSVLTSSALFPLILFAFLHILANLHCDCTPYAAEAAQCLILTLDATAERPTSPMAPEDTSNGPAWLGQTRLLLLQVS